VGSNPSAHPDLGGARALESRASRVSGHFVRGGLAHLGHARRGFGPEQTTWSWLGVCSRPERRKEGGAAQPQPMGQGGLRGESRPSRRAKRSRRLAVEPARPESRLPDPEAWLENVAFPEPADDPALAELEDEDLVLGADELEFDVEQWREASERYATSGRGASRRAAQTARVQSRRTRALPRQESSRRDPRRSGSNTGPTRRIPRASAPISPSVRSRAARSVTARLRPLPPRPAAQPPEGRPSQPCWGATVRRPSFRVSRGGLSRAQALAVTWPELKPAEPAPTRRRPPLEVLALGVLSLGLLLAIGGPFLLRSRAPQGPERGATTAALTSAPAGPLASAPAPASQAAEVTSPRAEGPGAVPGSQRAGAAKSSSGDAARSSRRARSDPRLRRRGSRAQARRLAEEEILGTVGGARLRFGLACGTYGAAAFVPLRLEQLPDLPAARTLTWELRHDARLEVEALTPGPAAREAGASVDFEALGPGRVRLRVSGGRPLGTGELCVLRLRVPTQSEEARLPPYLPLEAIALRLDQRAPQLGAGARGALRLEP
jgi:hypothetical protein